MRPIASHLSRLGLTAAIIAISGCAGATPTGSTLGPSGRQATPAPATPAVVPSDRSTTSDAWLVVGRAGETGLRVLLASSLEQLYELPIGAPDETWGRLLTVTPGADSTWVSETLVQPDLPATRQEIEGRWMLPTVGLDPMPLGVSADRSMIALAAADDGSASTAARGTTRFALLDGALDTTPQVIELAGAFEYDALSPDGSILYVAESIPGPLAGRYQVRAVDTATGTLRDAIIVDKRNLDEQMAGVPIDQERRADGLVMTLYRGADYPFVHALHSIEAWAVCIDLPTRGFDDLDAASDWGIVSSADGRAGLAVNATLGIAVDIHPTDLTIRRTVEFEPVAAGGVVLAKFGHAQSGPVGRRVVAAPNGSAVYAAGTGGIVRIDADDLVVVQRYLEGTAVGALALSPDGRTIFALTRDEGRIARLDAVSGDLLGWVEGRGYDRLVGVAPW